MVTRSNFVCKNACVAMGRTYHQSMAYTLLFSNWCTNSVNCVFKTSALSSLVWFLRHVCNDGTMNDDCFKKYLTSIT